MLLACCSLAFGFWEDGVCSTSLPRVTADSCRHFPYTSQPQQFLPFRKSSTSSARYRFLIFTNCSNATSTGQTGLSAAGRFNDCPVSTPVLGGSSLGQPHRWYTTGRTRPVLNLPLSGRRLSIATRQCFGFQCLPGILSVPYHFKVLFLSMELTPQRNEI